MTLSFKPRPNDRNMPTQHIATLLGDTCCVCLATVLRHVGCCWHKFDQFQTWANNTQHVATHRNTVAMLRQTMLRYVVLACCDRLAGALRFVRARVQVRTLMMWKSCAVGMRNAIQRNYLKALPYTFCCHTWHPVYLNGKRKMFKLHVPFQR